MEEDPRKATRGLRVSECLHINTSLIVHTQDWNSKVFETEHQHSYSHPFFKFPSLTDFVYFASAADEEFPGVRLFTSEAILQAKKQGKGAPLDRFSVFAHTELPSKNGYFGLAFMSKQAKQVVISHKGLFERPLSPQVSSALTFAHHITSFCEENDFTLFHTGRSCGGWLAQVTCFSSMYLTLQNQADFVFQLKSPVQLPYTVVFDCISPYEFIRGIKQEFNIPSDKEYLLPIEVYLLHFSPTDYYGGQNKHDGGQAGVFVLNESKNTSSSAWSTWSRIPPVYSTPNRDLETAISKLQDGEMEAKEAVLESKQTLIPWAAFLGKQNNIKIVPANPNTINIAHFFTENEQNFLKNAREEYFSQSGRGHFEGTNYVDEKSMNELVRLCRSDQWNFFENNEDNLVLECPGIGNRQNFIPWVRHVVRCLSSGSLWWNPVFKELPTDYIDRGLCRTEELAQEPVPECFTLKEMISFESDRLIVIANPLGAGKSITLRKLETHLRECIPWSRVIVRTNNLQRYKNSLDLQSVIKTSFPYLQQKNLQRGQPLDWYVLFDEDIPSSAEEAQEIFHILQCFLQSAATKNSGFRIRKVVVTLNTNSFHLQQLISQKFKVQLFSLQNLSLDKMHMFLRHQLNTKNLYQSATSALHNLPLPTIDLVSSSFRDFKSFCKYISSQSNDLRFSTKNPVEINLSTFYAHIVYERHYLCYNKMEVTDEQKKFRVENAVGSSLKYYYFVSLSHLLSSAAMSNLSDDFKPLIQFIEKPTAPVTMKLMKYGLLSSADKSEKRTAPVTMKLMKYGLLSSADKSEQPRFIHRSFEAYFLAHMLSNSHIPVWLSEELLSHVMNNPLFYLVEKFLEDIETDASSDKTKKFRFSVSCSNMRESVNHGIQTGSEDCNDEGWEETISKSLTELCDCTMFTTDFVTLLFQENLINSSEFAYLTDFRIPNKERAIKLYTEMTIKWDDDMMKKLKTALKYGNNYRASHILRQLCRKPSYRVTTEVIPLLKHATTETSPSNAHEHAETFFKTAMKMRIKDLGPNSPDVATLLNNQALVFCNQKEYEIAELLFQRALGIREAALDKDHPVVATSLNNLCVSYMYQRKFENAMPVCSRALKIRETALGADHPDVSTSLYNLGILYLIQGKFKTAKPLFQRAKQIWEQTFGTNLQDVNTLTRNRDSLFYNLKYKASAERLGTTDLKIQEAAFGLDYPDVPTSLNNQSFVFCKQRKYEKAEPLFQRALQIREAALGRHHPDVATSLNYLCVVYMFQGKFENAKFVCKRALEIREAALGPFHPDVATSLSYMGVLSYNQREYEKAESLFQRALEIRVTAFGYDHPDVKALEEALRKKRTWSE